MNLTDLPGESVVFVDANVFVYAMAGNDARSLQCQEFLRQVDADRIGAVTSTTILHDVAHRLMTLEACETFGWSYQGIARRMKRHAADIRKLTKFRTAIEIVAKSKLRIIATEAADVVEATSVCSEFGLLAGDALVVAMMRRQGLSYLASDDSDFDVVPFIVRAHS